MNIVLLQSRLTVPEINQLVSEFPNYLFLSYTTASYKSMTSDQWSKTEIIFGHHLTCEELEHAPQLRWIHAPAAHLHGLCMEEIETKANIIVTNTREENITQIGEFALSAVMMLAKNWQHWKEMQQFPAVIWEAKWRDDLWSLNEKRFLQIGLEKAGTEIAKRAKEASMQVWGMSTKTSFHPHCQKVFSFDELHEVLPLCDVVSITLPRSKEFHHWFGQRELSLMKSDAILLLIGSMEVIPQNLLLETAQSGKLRGIVMDVSKHAPLPATSPLWNAPSVLITPDIAGKPRSNARISYRVFRYNLRQYTHSNFKDMRNLVGKAYHF